MISNVVNMQVGDQAQALNSFFDTLRTDMGKVCYGHKSVVFALEHDAVQTLLVSDHLFRSKNTKTRKEYVNLVQKYEKKLGCDKQGNSRVVVCSSQTQDGSRLKDMTGIAAIMHVTLPGIDDIEESDSNTSSSGDSDYGEMPEELKQGHEEKKQGEIDKDSNSVMDSS